MTDLQAELESLRTENARLRRLLKLTDAEAAPAQGTQTAWFEKAPGPVDARSSPQAKVEFYAALFGARRDVYAVRWENARTGKSGWMPAVEGGWRKGRSASDVRHLPLTPEVLAAHLTGDVHIGLYPMLAGDQTCWLAADFDGQAAMLDALAYLKAARARGRASRLGGVPLRDRRARVDLLHRSRAGSHRAPTRDCAGSRGHRDPWPDGPALLRPTLPLPGRAARARPRQPDRGPAPRQVAQARARRCFSTWPRWSRSRTSGSTSPPWSALPRSRSRSSPRRSGSLRSGHASTAPSPPGRQRPSRIRHRSFM